jgi:uncharacterized protein (UPF0335 family)
MAKNTEDDDLIEEAGAGVGHNSLDKSELERVIRVLEGINDEMSNLRQDYKAAMEVAAQKGLDKRMIREAVRMRALDQTVREERESLRDLYMQALGLV